MKRSSLLFIIFFVFMGCFPKNRTTVITDVEVRVERYVLAIYAGIEMELEEGRKTLEPYRREKFISTINYCYSLNGDITQSNSETEISEYGFPVPVFPTDYDLNDIARKKDFHEISKETRMMTMIHTDEFGWKVIKESEYMKFLEFQKSKKPIRYTTVFDNVFLKRSM